MLIGEIEFPESLIEAQKRGTLVVFAGAGVSMGPPANLPSFENLADEVAAEQGRAGCQSLPNSVSINIASPLIGQFQTFFRGRSTR